MLLIDHVGAVAVGSADVMTLPELSTAAQREVEGQDIPQIWTVSTGVTAQAPTPPNGLEEVSKFPDISPATQNWAVGHETE